jgi:hypothetical protein
MMERRVNPFPSSKTAAGGCQPGRLDHDVAGAGEPAPSVGRGFPMPTGRVRARLAQNC